MLFWSCALACTWLLPNHYRPWSTFHMDALAAIVCLMASVFVLFKASKKIEFNSFYLLVFLVCLVPLAQWFLGLVGTFGTAWISSLYLLGFLLALFVGAQWEQIAPLQAIDAIFFAIGIAGVISVGLQLHQWLSLDLLGVWSMESSYGRPYANFGQPNQLCTLLVWGGLSSIWGVHRKAISGLVALMLAGFLLIGIALTQSRTGWIGWLVVIAGLFFWRKIFAGTHTLGWLVASGGMLALLALLIEPAGKALLISPNVGMFDGQLDRISGEMRPIIWRLFWDAALERPWFGYGWNQVGFAQSAVAMNHQSLHQLYSHSHNIILDIVLWCGFPIALLIFTAVLRWFVRQLKAVRAQSDVIIFLFLLVIANHAMFELPLHHAYFLLPTGLAMGVLIKRNSETALISIGKEWVVGVCMVCLGMTTITIADYSKVESTYQKMRFEWAGLSPAGSTSQPNLYVLSDWQLYFWAVRFEPSTKTTSAEIKLLQLTTNIFPSPAFFLKLAYAFAIQGEMKRAEDSLVLLCKMNGEPQCRIADSAWRDMRGLSSNLD